jgi:hypothetical protein
VVRGGKSTLLLLVVLLGLGAYIYFVDSKKPVGEADAKEKAFAGIKADDIEEIQIKSAMGETSRLRKSDGNWRIVEPVMADTDQGELSSITSTLPELDIQRTVTEEPSDLKRYGLDPVRIEVTFREKGKTDEHHLFIGDKTPTGTDVYARTQDRKRVILLNASLDSTFNKNTFALRDKSVLKFDRDKVTSLELTNKSGTMQFAKSGTEWKIVKPLAARADFGGVESIVERLHSLQMQGIVTADAGTDLKKYGLDKPAATIAVGTGSARAVLLLGSTENAVVNAKDASRPMVFTLAPTIDMDVFKPIADLRRKDLFDARPFTVTRIELRRGTDTMAFEKSKNKDEKEIWKNAAGKEVDEMKMEDLLNRVTGLRADSFETAAPAALKTPALTVTARFDDGKMETVTFARNGADVVAGRADEPGAAKVMAAAFDDAIKALDAMK